MVLIRFSSFQTPFLRFQIRFFDGFDSFFTLSDLIFTVSDIGFSGVFDSFNNACPIESYNITSGAEYFNFAGNFLTISTFFCTALNAEAKTEPILLGFGAGGGSGGEQIPEIDPEFGNIAVVDFK